MEISNKQEILSAFESVMGNYINRDPEFIFSCPNKDCDSHKKNKLKFQINIEKHFFHCWVCEFRGRSLAYLAKYLNLNPSILGLESHHSDEIDLFDEDTSIPTHIESVPDNYILIDGNKSDTNNYLQAIKYLKKRKINNFDIIKYKIHYQSDGYSVLIPSYDINGNINTYFIRNIFDDMKIMPKYPKKFVVPNELFIDWNEPITLVEGFFDAFTAGDNTIPLLGSFLRIDYKLFQQLLIHQPPMIILALDKDAFEKKTLKIAKLLFKHGFKIKIVLFPTNDDINKIGKASYEALLNNADDYHELYEVEYTLINS